MVVCNLVKWNKEWRDLYFIFPHENLHFDKQITTLINLNTTPSSAETIEVSGRIVSVRTPRTFRPFAFVVTDEPKGAIGFGERLVIF